MQTYESNVALIDKMIGNAFPTVQNVSKNIEYIKHVSHHLPELYIIYEQFSTITALTQKINELEARITALEVI